MSLSPIIEKVRSSDVAVLLDTIKRLDSGTLISAPYLVFKVTTELLGKLADDKNSRGQIVSRYPDKLVYLLEYDKASAKHKIYLVQEGGLETTVDEALLKSIRQSDLLEVVRRGDCIIHAPDGTHFVTPSEKHTTKFLRLADAFHSYDALDRISYWLQAELHGVAGVVIDTWSLSSILLGSQLLLGENEKVPFDCFNRHIKNDDGEAERVLSELATKIEGKGPLLCLVSISSSGCFFDEFEKIVKKTNIQNEIKVLSLYKFEDTPKEIEALATLGFPLEWFEESECEYCAGGERTKLYQIDPKFYYPREHQEEAVKVNISLLQDEANKNKSAASLFIHRYGKQHGVLRVHRNDPNDGINSRHHAFYIDVATLLENAEFKQELFSKLDMVKGKNGEAIVVVAPPHKAGRMLAKIAGELFGAKYINHENMRKLSIEEKKLITSAQHILFIDDVLITGSRITQYLRALREEFTDEELQLLKRVTWFPIIARPSHKIIISSIEQRLKKHRWHNELTYLYEVDLPEWVGKKNCPWCQEAAIFEMEIETHFDEPDWYKERRNLLYGEESGISDNPLFILPGVDRCLAGNSSPMVEEGSCEMQVLFLLATALQGLRNDPKRPLGPSLFINYVISMYGIDGDFDIFQRYSEALFQAAFLRVIKRDEWCQNVKSKGVDYMAKLVSEGTSNVLLGEGVLFLHRLAFSNKLPDGFEKALQNWSHDDVVNLVVQRFRVDQ